MLEQINLTNDYRYTENLTVTKTVSGFSLTGGTYHDGSLGRPYVIDPVEFTINAEETRKVAYILHLVYDTENDKVDYLLYKSTVDQDGYYPSYNESEKYRLLYKIIDVVVDPTGEINGAIYSFTKEQEAENET